MYKIKEVQKKTDRLQWLSKKQRVFEHPALPQPDIVQFSFSFGPRLSLSLSFFVFLQLGSLHYKQLFILKCDTVHNHPYILLIHPYC